jgi:hypothetical protein
LLNLSTATCLHCIPACNNHTLVKAGDGLTCQISKSATRDQSFLASLLSMVLPAQRALPTKPPARHRYWLLQPLPYSCPICHLFAPWHLSSAEAGNSEEQKTHTHQHPRNNGTPLMGLWPCSLPCVALRFVADTAVHESSTVLNSSLRAMNAAAVSALLQAVRCKTTSIDWYLAAALLCLTCLRSPACCL